MKQGEFYHHFRKGTEYCFRSIALPLNEFRGNKDDLVKVNPAQDAHTPSGEPVREIQLYDYQGVTFIERDMPHVIYQSEEDYDTDDVWAREVEDFYGYKKMDDGTMVKRFVRQEGR